MYYEMIGFSGEHTQEPCQDGVPDVDLSTATLFLDFDGTLVDLADRPDGIEVDPGLSDLLIRLSRATKGRTVMVTGRAVEHITPHLGDFDGPIIGGHGAQERWHGEITRVATADERVVTLLGTMTEAFAETHPGLLCERKPTGVVLHFRQAEDSAHAAYTFFRALAETHEGFDLHHSKMAYELRPAGIGKDISIRRMMESDDFRGTRPIFFGDDVTDEPALAWVAGQDGGIAVKVGEGESAASCRLPDTAAVRDALSHWAGEA